MPKQHDSREVRKMFKEIETFGFVIRMASNGSYRIYPMDKSLPVYFTHGTQASLHPLRRDFRKLYGIELTGC